MRNRCRHRRRHFAVLATAVSFCFTLGAISSGCLSLAKKGDALDAVRTFDDYATLSQCPGFNAFQQSALPSIISVCSSCHTAGGKGAGKFQFNGGDATDNEFAARNYALIKPKATPADTTGDFEHNTLLLRMLNGDLPHDIKLSGDNSDYGAMVMWVQAEHDQPCTIDPVTGAVSVPEPSPTP
jgi:hypothetical protein